MQELDLGERRLRGTVPSLVWSLPFLERLVLSDNPDMKISMVGIEKAKYLHELILSNTGVTSLAGIRNAISLERLHLTDTEMGGTFPEEVLGLGTLRSIYANWAGFTGTLSSKIGDLRLLEELYLYQNDMTGTLPTEIGRMVNLQVLGMGHNALGGTIPNQLNYLTNLEVLSLERAHGEEKGVGLTGPLPVFDNLRSLTALYLENQMLTGTIPTSFLSGSPRAEPITAQLSNNGLEGTVPELLGEFDRLNIDLTGNKISAIPSALCSKSYWMNGEVGYAIESNETSSGCDAILCPIGYWNDDGYASDEYPCLGCSDELPYMGSWECRNPDAAMTQFTLLKEFFKVLGGNEWYNTRGWVSDDSECEWHGVECNEDGNIMSIDLQDNGLMGTPPAFIFSLPNLQSLNLMANGIDFRFNGIDQAKSLNYLYLSNTGLGDITDIEQLEDVPLRELHISQNNLEGTIPASIFNVKSLTYISISHNKFTGTLPVAIGKLNRLVEFHAYGNRLTGQIPTTLGDIGSSLQMLVLSENDFGGTLPTHLNRLINLETFSMHQTTKSGLGVVGTMPSWEDCVRLTKLHLNSNSLAGNLPPGLLMNSQVLDAVIEINLSDNDFEGIVPNDWTRFSKLKLGLAGNKLEYLESADICEMSEWNGGDVGLYGCGAIMCPRGYYNGLGRMTDSEDCTLCDEGGKYMGGTRCDNPQLPTPINPVSDILDTPPAPLPSPLNIELLQKRAYSRAILEKFYYSTAGTEWDYNAGWLDEPDVCNDWYGISCDDAGDVTHISLAENGLTGTPSIDIWNLPELRELDLQGNAIGFNFAAIGNAKKLHTIYLSDTGISSLEGIGAAVALNTFHCTSNNIAVLPDEIFSVITLERLFLNYNRIAGRLSPLIGNLVDLQELYLMSNQLVGQIPAAVGDLTKLKVLALTKNHFGGTLPVELNDMTNLEILAIQREGGVDDNGSAGGNDVGNNQGESDKSDGITGPLLAFDHLANLKELYLGSNSLTGTIPYNFLSGINNPDRTVVVDLVSNRLTGTVPSALTHFNAMTLFAAGNRFVDVALGLCNKDNWMGGDVGWYGCDAVLCKPETFSEYGRRKDDWTPCDNCPANTHTDYWGSFECTSNAVAGEQGPASVGAAQEAQILREFYDAVGGARWTLDTNWGGNTAGGGTDDFCNWHGVQCVSDSVKSVQGLRLPKNGLAGTVPSSVFSLPNLMELNIGSNADVVVRFEGIEKAIKLTYLNLDGIGLQNFNGLRNAQSLKLLHVMGNRFAGGAVPEDILSLVNLEVLYMSNNGLNGSIDPTLGQKLQNLVYLQCYNCGLKGPLPTWFANLPRLEYLRLDQNSLTGPIPPELAAASLLEHLDLSNQISRGGVGLIGPLPSFAGMGRLTELYLDNNAITGIIPTDFLIDAGGGNLEVKVDLSQNHISGGIPSELGRLSGLMINVGNNEIAIEVPAEVCALAFADDLGCDGILCPPNTFNPVGRKTPGSDCVPCSTKMANYYGSTHCDVGNQRDILEKLFYATRGAEWEVNDGWTTEVSVCDWHGITCSPDGTRVTSIALDDNGLNGDIPTDIFTLPGLETIILKENDVAFSMVGIENASSLRMLSLSETGLDSIDGIGSVKDTLRYLHLTDNNLTSIPDEIYQLINLEDLHLNYNDVNSKLSTEIGLLTNLRNLYMFANSLVGTLPTELGNLKKLRVLAMGENYITGTIPTELNKLVDLEIIALQLQDGEAVTTIGGALYPKLQENFGKGLTGLLPTFNGLRNLRELYLGANSLSGEIPNDFLSSVDKTSEIIIDLTMNELAGVVPDFLKEFDQLTLYAGGNKFDRMSPSLCKKDNWMGGETAAGGCDAILCRPGTFNMYGRAASNQIPCEQCPFTYEAKFYGSVACLPTHTGSYSDREVLSMLYESTGGDNWLNKMNWMSGNKPLCSWHGVICNTDQDAVIKIDLSSNNLGGTVPPMLFQMEHLQGINLRDNSINFEFKGIETAPVLRELFLDSTKLISLDGIGKAKKLQVLHLQQNNFNGEPIPEEIFELKSLRHLDLSDSLFGGTLPSAIEELSLLEEFYCRGNEITGTIPSSIGNLNYLEVLVLSENRFIGTIPSEMSAMMSLRSLFIDSFTRRSVGLSGQMPDFSGAVNLREIYLNANGLTGTVPADLLSNLEDKDTTVTLGLKSNQFTGTVPTELKRFGNLNIDLAGNQITGVDQELCSMGDWMSGLVGRFNCDAILCPPGTYNLHGRQYNADSDCIPCNGDIGDIENPFYGALMCQSVERKKEKETLMHLYQQCGGENWKNKDNWMQDDLDVCEWYGINCHESKLVDSILLGSNNLIGTPPKEIFDMAELKWLWLYANPIEFKFDGIGNALKLTSLLLDSTGLNSLDGVEDASVLEDLDVRFNKLKGELPRGLSKLVNLKSFSCADNQLSGFLPSFRSLKKLERLRMGGNKFDGIMPDYSTHSDLKSLDLSDNALRGPIPPTLLKNLDHSQSTYIDLSSNQLTGTVPSELDIFDKLTIYLRDNRFTGINPSLCDNDEWNDGDVGSFQCDAIMCPQGSYGPSDGRASKAGAQCIPCKEVEYFGSSICRGSVNGGYAPTLRWVVWTIAMATGALLYWVGV